MTGAVYLLDTSVLLPLVRGKEFGKHISSTFHLEDVALRPLVCIVTVGEIWVIADRNGWGPQKREALQKMLANLVIVDLNDEGVLDAYVELDRVSQTQPKGAMNIPDNDLWIAATARAAGAVLLTADKHFLHFHPNHCLVGYVDPTHWLGGGTSRGGRLQ